MEAKSRSQGLLLAALFVVLALALWWNFGGGATGPARRARRRPRAGDGTGAAARRAAPPDAAVELIALDRLENAAPEPMAAGRNPFRFEAQRQTPPAGDVRSGGQGEPDA